MPFGVNKAVLFGAAGSGGESGWVVEPTTSTHGDGWIYNIALDSENNVWFTQLASSSNQLPVGQVMADGTAGAANNWKSMDPKGGNYASGRGIAVDSTNDKIYLAGDGVNDSGNQYESLLVGMTDGTLVQDWDVMRAYSSGNQFFYFSPITVGANYLGSGRSVFSAPYIYDSGQSHYFAVIGQNNASTGSIENLTGGSGGSVVRYYGSYGQSIYPYSVIRATTNSNPWVYAAFSTSTMQRFGFFGNRVNTTTYNRRAYTFYSGSNNPQMGGICECDADYLYITVQEPGAASELTLLKVAKSDGAISWQRKMIIHNFSSSSTHYTTPPVTDSNGNIYVAWTLTDSQNIVGNYYRMHWASWDSSGNLRTLDGTGVKSFFDTSGNQHYVTSIRVSSDDNFVYMSGATNSPYDPYITKFPTDGTGTDNTGALSGNTDGTYHYRNDLVYTESAGDIEYDSQYANITNWADWNQTNDDVNDATQASGVAVRLDELA